MRIKLEEIIEFESTCIRNFLSECKIKNIKVDNNIPLRDASDFQNSLNYGLFGCDEINVSILVSSDNCSYYKKNIVPVLIPRSLKPPLFTDQDNKVMGTNLFYIFENDKIIPIRTKNPIPLDGLDYLNAFEDENPESYVMPENIIIQNRRIHKLTEDKLECKKIFLKAGLKTPDYYIITKNDLKCLKEKVQGFENGDGFAVKGRTGFASQKVKLFSNGEEEKACDFIRKLINERETVFLEKRVHPLEWKDKKGKLIDWNIRALITLSDRPRWIDAEVRYKVKDNNCVAVSLGSKIEELERIADITGFSIDKVKRDCSKVSRGIYNRLKKDGTVPASYLGLDLIVSNKGLYILEANSCSVGGFGSLMKLRKKPLDSVPLLLKSYGPFLASNYEENRKRIKKCTHPILIQSKINYFDFGRKLVYDDKKYAKAIKFLKKAITLEYFALEINSLIGCCYYMLEEYGKAIGHLERAIRLQPNNKDEEDIYLESHVFLGHCYLNLGEYDKAIKLLEKVIRLKSKNKEFKHPAISNFLIGYGYYMLEEYGKAIGPLERAVKLQPDDEDMHYYLGLAYEGYYGTKAIEEYSKVLDIDCLHEGALEGLKRILKDGTN